MILLWLLCTGLVLGGLLASLARWIPWSKLQGLRLRQVPALVPAPRPPCRRLAKGRRGRHLAPPELGPRAGPPG